MADLVAIQRCEDEKTWIGFPAEVVRQACISVCGEEMMTWCWGSEGPQGGDLYECNSAYCQIVWTMPEQEIQWLEPEVA